MKNIAIITARSGSKGLPHKNIKMLNGRPLLAWSIKAAIDSGMFDTVMVSTDSEEYAKIAREYGAEVPFLRSEATSSDNSSSWSVVEEVLEKYKGLGKTFDTFVLLQPTSPLRTGKNIKEAYDMLLENDANAIIAVTECEFNPLYGRALTGKTLYSEDSVYLVRDFQKDFDRNGYYRRQALPKFYRTNGAIYLCRVDRFEADHNFADDNCYSYTMPQENSLDIDTELDFVIAEAVMKHFDIK
jgi:CMP-N,N'-diacetyllegionaminic acid synthase